MTASSTAEAARGGSRPPRRAFHVPPRVFAWLATYLVACWGTLILLVRGASPAGAWILAAIAIYTALPIFLFLQFGGWPFYPGRYFRLLVVRPFWYAQVLLPLITASAVLGIAFGALVGEPLAGGRTFSAAVLVAMLVIFAAGYVGSKRLVVARVDVSLPDLPAEFDGLRIAQITDLHLGPHISRRSSARVLRAVQAARPDLIAVTGDIVDDRPEDVALFAERFADLDAPLGVFFIAGNHDVYANWSDVERELERHRIGTLLVNESVIIQRAAARLAIVGTGDPAAARLADMAARVAPDVERSLRDVPADTLVIALAHNPAVWPQLAARGVALTLSGHTHWGQLAIPRLEWSLASPFLRHAMGAYRESESLLYISPGTGYWGIPFRLGAPSEVTVFTLRRGPRGIVIERDSGATDSPASESGDRDTLSWSRS